MVLVQVPYVVLNQFLAILPPAMIFRTMYLLMTLKSKSLADIFFWFPDVFSNLVDIFTRMCLRPLKLSKFKTKLLLFLIESALTLSFLFQWMAHHPLCCKERNLGIIFFLSQVIHCQEFIFDSWFDFIIPKAYTFLPSKHSSNPFIFLQDHCQPFLF